MQSLNEHCTIILDVLASRKRVEIEEAPFEADDAGRDETGEDAAPPSRGLVSSTRKIAVAAWRDGTAEALRELGRATLDVGQRRSAYFLSKAIPVFSECAGLACPRSRNLPRQPRLGTPPLPPAASRRIRRRD